MTHQIIDISSKNQHPIDFNAVKACGIDAVMIKATEGTDYTNPDFEADRNGAQAAGLKVAAYHYSRQGDPAAEAAHFKAVAGVDAKVLDIETAGDAAWVDEFLTDLGQPTGEEMTYGSASTLPNVDAIRGLLWSAAWGPTAPSQGEALWQYTDTGQVPGIQGNVDRSQWLGTEEQYVTFFSGAPGGPGQVPSPSSGPPASQPNPPQEPQPAPAFPPFSGHLLVFPPETAGSDVRIWQQRMQDRGWHITADGVYGPLSKQICEAFQHEKGLVVDGIVGPKTWDAAWLAPVTRP